MTAPGAVWALAVTQTLGYACLYYIFAALVVAWQADFGWSEAQLALGPTLAIVISGGLAPLIGRLVDRGWSLTVMSGGTVLGALGLSLLALAESRAAYLTGWAIMGAAQSMVLYEVCFAFLIRRMGPGARSAIIKVTLVAGFASTIAFPAAAYVSEAFGWRVAVWGAVAVVLGVNLPLNALAVRTLRRGERAATAAEDRTAKAAARAALRQVRFWLLGGALALLSLNHWMLIAFVIPIFTALGASPDLAVLAAAVVGPAQVVGRLTLMRFDSGAANRVVLWLCLGAMALGTGVLWAAGAAPALILGFATLQGAAIGIMTILRPVLIVDVLGQEGYGAIAGALQVMPLLAAAAAPLLGGVLFGVGGAGLIIAMSFGVLALAALLVAALRL